MRPSLANFCPQKLGAFWTNSHFQEVILSNFTSDLQEAAMIEQKSSYGTSPTVRRSKLFSCWTNTRCGMFPPGRRSSARRNARQIPARSATIQRPSARRTWSLQGETSLRHRNSGQQCYKSSSVYKEGCRKLGMNTIIYYTEILTKSGLDIMIRLTELPET